MGIRLGVGLGVFCWNDELLAELRKVLEIKFSEFSDDRTPSRIIDEAFFSNKFDDYLQAQIELNLEFICQEFGWNKNSIKLELYREHDDQHRYMFEVREFPYKEDTFEITSLINPPENFPKHVNPVLFKTEILRKDFRYGNLLDSYLIEEPKNTIKILGGGIYPDSGYFAKKTTSNYTKSKIYYWQDVCGYFDELCEQLKIEKSFKDRLTSSEVCALIGVSEQFHPNVSAAVLFCIYTMYDFCGKAAEFDLLKWQTNLWPALYTRFS